MTKFVLISLVAALPFSAFGQAVFRCTIGGSVVYQDRPCPGTARYSSEMPANGQAQPVDDGKRPEAGRSDAQQKLERDKEYLAKAGYERQKTEARERAEHCDREALYIQASIDQEAARPAVSMGDSTRGLLAMQLEQERKQTVIAGLQSKVLAKRHECETLRKESERRNAPYVPALR